MESPTAVKCLNSQHSCMVKEHNRKAWKYQSCVKFSQQGNLLI